MFTPNDAYYTLSAQAHLCEEHKFHWRALNYASLQIKSLFHFRAILTKQNTPQALSLRTLRPRAHKIFSGASYTQRAILVRYHCQKWGYSRANFFLAAGAERAIVANQYADTKVHQSSPIYVQYGTRKNLNVKVSACVNFMCIERERERAWVWHLALIDSIAKNRRRAKRMMLGELVPG